MVTIICALVAFLAGLVISAIMTDDKWIDVKDQTPKVNELLLVSDIRGVVVPAKMMNGVYYSLLTAEPVHYVEHWRYLPIGIDMV